MARAADLSNMRKNASVMREQDQQADLEEHYRMGSRTSNGDGSNTHQRRRDWRQRIESEHTWLKSAGRDVWTTRGATRHCGGIIIVRKMKDGRVRKAVRESSKMKDCIYYER